MKLLTSYFPFIVMIFIIAASSCTAPREYIYLEGLGQAQDTIYQREKITYRLQPSDILYIRIITQDPQVNEMYNPSMAAGGASLYQSSGLYIMGFEVKDSGYIELPVLKKIQVAGLTLQETQDSITSVAMTYLKDPQVIVKLHTFEISVLGEVNHPGILSYASYELNLIEAIALAGDITYAGNRENILIMRPSSDKYEVRRVNLTDKNILRSKDFVIQPNDIIYVEPIRRTLFRESTADYMYFVSVFSGVTSLILLLLSIL